MGDTDLEMKPFHGEHTWQEAAEAIRGQIDHSCPIPYLLLKHKNLELDDYVWHWFMLTGYRETEEGFQVKAVYIRARANGCLLRNSGTPVMREKAV